MDLCANPDRAPDYKLYRFVTAQDATPADMPKKAGLNCQNYRTILVQIVPVNTNNPAQDFSGAAIGTSNPNVEVYFWNDGLKKFVKGNPAITKTGLGASTPYEFEIEADGRIILIALTNAPTASQGVAMFVSGFGLEMAN